MTQLNRLELEQLAKTLEASDDYQVLRRFRPRDRYKETSLPPEALGHGVILDTETTGREPGVDRIIELGLVRFRFERETGEVVDVTDVYNSLEDPGMPISPEASRVNGITDEMVKGQRIDDTVVEQMVQGADLVIAHNAYFDREFCERRWPLFKELAWGCSREQIDWAAENITGTKLDYIAFRLGFFYAAHRAEVDCLALLEALSRPLPVSGRTGLKHLLGRYNHKEVRLWATDTPFEKKNVLAARGYKWGDGTGGKEKAWYTTLPEERLEEEIAWLRAHVYGRPGRVVLDTVDARCRFSPRRIGTWVLPFA